MTEATSVLVEKYRPQTINGIILPEEIKKIAKSMIDGGEVQNTLLIGPAGVGKTTLAKAICEELKAVTRYINISLESGIDTARSQIVEFARTRSFSNQPKVFILDEFDGAGVALQKALRGLLEEYHETCRFILTANYENKIIQPLREGRTIQLNFNFQDKAIQSEMIPKVYKRVCGILKKEEISYDDEAVKLLIEKFYPNIRKIISRVQKIAMSNAHLSVGMVSKIDSENDELYEHIINCDFIKARTYIIQNSLDFSDVYTMLYKNYIQKLEPALRAESILTIAEYAANDAMVVDQEIQLAACILQLTLINARD